MRFVIISKNHIGILYIQKLCLTELNVVLQPLTLHGHASVYITNFMRKCSGSFGQRRKKSLVVLSTYNVCLCHVLKETLFEHIRWNECLLANCGKN